MRVTIPYTPRKHFIPLHERKQRWGVIVAHRRAGKTVATVNDLIRAALLCDKPDGRFAYAAPYYSQAKDVAWTYLKKFTAPIPGVMVNENELRVDLPNGARVRLYGIDKYDRLRGIYLDAIVLDEWGDADPRAWSEVIRPALSDRQGWAVFLGTPKGKNHFWELWNEAQQRDDWLSLMLRADQTGVLLEEELEDARRSMTEDAYAQEYLCSFEAALQGAYYGKLMQAAEEEGRISRVPWEPKAEVVTAWDLGIGDCTAIWFVQRVNREIRVIDHYEANGVGLDHYVKLLREKPYVYGRHYLPHDVEVSELGTGKTRLETLRSLGMTNVTVVAKLGVDDGINAVRMLLPTVWIDKEKCARGIESLRQYRAEFDGKLNVFKMRPLHDWTSHSCDSFRYLAVGLQEEPRARKPLVHNTRNMI
jgi:phage terminase large subunit